MYNTYITVVNDFIIQIGELSQIRLEMQIIVKKKKKKKEKDSKMNVRNNDQR